MSIIIHLEGFIRAFYMLQQTEIEQFFAIILGFEGLIIQVVYIVSNVCQSIWSVTYYRSENHVAKIVSNVYVQEHAMWH